MRAIGYFHLNNGHGSIEEMRELFSDYCDRYLHQPVETFGEDSEAENGQHPQYRRMLQYINDSKSNFLIVVPNASHLGTDLESVARSMVELEATGSKVTCAEDDMPDPLQNALQRLGAKGVSRVRSERIKESMRERALMGKGLGKPPYGYRNGQDGMLEVVKDEASVVELIYRLYTSDGLGLRLIAQHLNGRTIPTRRGGKWNMVTIRDILKNPTYMGTYTRFGLRLPKSHEAIIPPKLFREAQDETKVRRPSGRVINAKPFLLSGIVYCRYCGNKMMGVTRRQSWRRKDGRRANGVYRYYQCQSRNNQSLCEYHTWRAPLLERTVLTHLKYTLQVRASSEITNGASAERREEVQMVWETRVKNAERRFLQAMKRTSKGELGLETLGHYLSELDKARKGANNSVVPGDIDTMLGNWETLEFEERQSFLMEHIAKVVVQDESVELLV